jgi:phosphatidylglycerol:prolipoprotein diacylglycerol transferase
VFPKLINVGSFYLPTYGVLVALGFLAGIWITMRLAKSIGLNPEKVSNLAVYTAIAGLAGAKLMMFAFDWRYFSEHPGEIFSLSTLQAAGVFQGGLILAIIVAYLYMQRQGLPFLRTADCFAPGIAIGHAIGRLGCLAAGCCWGDVCDRAWAITFRNPEARELTGVPLGVPLHPSQIYDSAAQFLVFIIVYRLFFKLEKPGMTLGIYLVLSSLARFIIEFFRFHEQGLHATLSWPQWIALGLVGLGLFLIARARAATLAPAAR